MISKYALPLLLFAACSDADHTTSPKALPIISELEGIEGKHDYLGSPFVTAGNRVYMIGEQDGSFADIGWHIKGEMGGVWDHPIKLLDGFSAVIQIDEGGESYCLDSASRFINYPFGNEHLFEVTQAGIDVQRFQFVPDSIEGIIIQYKLINKTSESKHISFCFNAKSDLRPTWLADSLNVSDGQDEVRFDSETSRLIFRDQKNPWYTIVGSILHAEQEMNIATCRESFAPDMGVSGALCFSLTLKPNSEQIVPIYISGSYESEEAARSSFELLNTKASHYLSNKIERFQKMTSRSGITIPDEGLSQMYEWLKYNIDWMIREIPGEGIGLSAGLPDYPWWFGADATYSLQGVLATGDHELVKSTIQLLNKISKRTNSNGRVIHEVSTNGVVYNRGNVNETAQFVTLVNNYFQWTGDSVLVKEIFPDLKKGMEWLIDEKDPDRNGYPNGSGMMEIPGLESELEMIDVAVYTQQALESASVLAAAIGQKRLAEKYNGMAMTLKDKINKQWRVSDQKSYGDFRSGAAEGQDILKAALVRSDTMKKAPSVRDLNKLQRQLSSKPAITEETYLIYKNWVVNTPMETGIATSEHAIAALQTSRQFQNAYGLFVTGIDKSDEPDSVVLASRKKIFSYTGAVMTLPTGVIAVGAAKYGQIDMALESIKKLERSFSYALPGSMYEVSPDFGMMTQAWNIYGVAVPLVTEIFGIHPSAPKKLIRISPRLPSAWETAAIENVRVGNNSIDVSIKKDGEFLMCEVEQKDPEWIFEFKATAIVLRGDDAKPSQWELKHGYRRFQGRSLKILMDPRK